MGQLLWARQIPVGAALQRLSDDVFAGDLGAKEFAGDLRHGGIAFFGRAFGGHRGRGADAKQLGVKPLPHPPHQQRYVRTLAPPVGMQLIEDQELQSLGIADDLLIEWILTGQDVLEHHIVCEQDVGWIILDLFSFFVAFLPCVASESDLGPLWIAKAEIFL